MTMTKSELRGALKAKLDHRRQLMQENTGLRGDVRREQERNKFLLSVVSNPLVDRALEDCADQIMTQIVEEAAKLSEVVAAQSVDNGDYVVGIYIPEFHFQHRISRHDLRAVGSRHMRHDSVTEITARGDRYGG